MSAGPREVELTSAGRSQRLGEEAATVFPRLMEALSNTCLQAAAQTNDPLRRRFRAVIVEDSSMLAWPAELDVEGIREPARAEESSSCVGRRRS